jgi:hypothetical protein
MPKIKWLGLPPDLRRHLFDRAKERRISIEDILALEEWRRHSPDVPDGLWYKDFGSFKLCGEGRYPKTFLLKGQIPYGWGTRSSPIGLDHLFLDRAHAPGSPESVTCLEEAETLRHTGTIDQPHPRPRQRSRLPPHPGGRG